MRLITRRQRLLIMTFSVLLLSFVIFPLQVMAWENPLVIADTAGHPGHKYEKPEICFTADGAVCIAYMDNNEETSSHFSDIYLCTYDGKEMKYENVSNATQYFGKPSAYETDADVTSDGRIHVAWLVKDRSTSSSANYIQYRYKDKNTWSSIVTLGAINVRESDYGYDLRLAVSNNGNVHVLVSRGADAGVFYVAKYGSTITPVDSLGEGRSKHPDVAVNDDYVHGVWMQHNPQGLYVIVHQKWENKVGGAWGEIESIADPYGDWGCGKVRTNLDSSGRYHVVMFFNYGESATRELRYGKELANGDFSDWLLVSDPEGPRLYHFTTLEIRDNSMITTMQMGGAEGGQAVCYNWQKNGVWGGYQVIPNTGGAAHDSVDLSADGKIAAVAYASGDTAIMLVTSDKITAKTLQADFTYPDMVFCGSSVLFNASQCSALNPDFSIVSYKWNFGDGQTQTTASNTITHQYNTYDTDVRVTLTITSATGETGSISKNIRLHALYSAILTAAKKMQLRTLFYNRPAYEIQWTANPKNTQAGYPTIAKYEIWRAPASSSAANTDSSAEYGIRGTHGTRTAPGKPGNPAVAAYNYVLVTQVDASVSRYMDYSGLQKGTNYVYTIISVDSEGHKSPFDHY